MAKIPEFVMQSYRYTERQSESAPAKMKAAAAQAEGAQAVNQAAARAPAEMPASPPLAQASVSPPSAGVSRCTRHSGATESAGHAAGDCRGDPQPAGRNRALRARQTARVGARTGKCRAAGLA